MNQETDIVLDRDLILKILPVLEEKKVTLTELFNSLFIEIIKTGEIPFPINRALLSRDEMSVEHFNLMLEKAYKQALNNQGVTLEEAFGRFKKE